MAELVFQRQAAAEYDRAFAHVARYFMPFVLHAARIASGMRVLDIAAGTGLSAEAALSAVGPTGHVTAADVSPAMVETLYQEGRADAWADVVAEGAKRYIDLQSCLLDVPKSPFDIQWQRACRRRASI